VAVSTATAVTLSEEDLSVAIQRAHTEETWVGAAVEYGLAGVREGLFGGR
jgi:hypothetical protein